MIRTILNDMAPYEGEEDISLSYISRSKQP